MEHGENIERKSSLRDKDPVADPVFPDGEGAPTSQFRGKTYYFAKKLHEHEKNWRCELSPHAGSWRFWRC